MSNRKPSTLINLLYDKEEIKKHFGTEYVHFSELSEYKAKRYNLWTNEIIVPYNNKNLITILKEEKELGIFNIIHKLNIKAQTIIIRAENSEDLTYLKLKYSWS